MCSMPSSVTIGEAGRRPELRAMGKLNAVQVLSRQSGPAPFRLPAEPPRRMRVEQSVGKSYVQRTASVRACS